MKYEDRIMCFIDILGFKKHIIETDTKDIEVNSRNIKNLVCAIEAIRYFTDNVVR